MKILQINTRYKGGGGAAEIAGSLHRNINEKTEHESVFLYGRGEANDSNAICIGNKVDVYNSALSARILGKPINIYFDKRIEKYICESDIIHLHNIHGYYMNYDLLINLINKYDKKVVWTFHDVWPITGRCAFSFGCDKWKSGCRKCENKQIYPKTMVDRSAKDWRLKRNLFNSLNKEKTVVITPSKWLKDILKESYLKEYRIEVINNGIERPSEFKESKEELRAKYNIGTDAKVILFVAADPNDARKGMKYILDIIPDMKDYLFISVGKKIDNLQYSNLIQLGYIGNKDELNKIYSLSDVYVIPSIDDNFPTTVLEAFSNGIPVVGFNCGGIKEQIGNECGKLVELGNKQQLIKAIEELLLDIQLHYKLKSNVREIFNEKYTSDIFLQRYIYMYKE